MAISSQTASMLMTMITFHLERLSAKIPPKILATTASGRIDTTETTLAFILRTTYRAMMTTFTK